MAILVLGLGNDLYGDDGVGLRVVGRLKQDLANSGASLNQPRDVDYSECCLSGLSLLDVIVGYDALIIVDTIKKPYPQTGRVHILEGKDLRAIPGPSPHYVSVPQTLEIGRRAGLQVPTKVKVIAVEAKNTYTLGEGLTEEMEKRVPAIMEKVKEVLDSLKREAELSK